MNQYDYWNEGGMGKTEGLHYLWGKFYFVVHYIDLQLIHCKVPIKLLCVKYYLFYLLIKCPNSYDRHANN